MDRPDYFAVTEVVAFHGRDEDDWYYLEWWGPAIGWTVYEAPKTSLISIDPLDKGIH